MLPNCFYVCACQEHDSAFFVYIVNEKFASQILFFQDALTFQTTIALCYNTQSVTLQSCVTSPRIWVVCEVVKILSLIVSGYVLN
jgi:hypothetical protein